MLVKPPSLTRQVHLLLTQVLTVQHLVVVQDQASEVRFVFPVGYGVPASGLQVRRQFRTGESDDKVPKNK